MAADSDGDVIETVVTCKGNLEDPDFQENFNGFVSQLEELICSTEASSLKVNKVEPWNSVRVTLSIPRDAAHRLRLLAQQGHQALRSLGILSVQVEGDQIISLTIVGRNDEPQEISLQPPAAPVVAAPVVPEVPAPVAGSVVNHRPAFPVEPAPVTVPPVVTAPTPAVTPLPSAAASNVAPNVVAPVNEPIPFSPKTARPSGSYGPFPFTSMTHAASAMQRESQHGTGAGRFPFAPPPPYPGTQQQPAQQTAQKVASNIANHVAAKAAAAAAANTNCVASPASAANVALSSPLLVNLLQNEAPTPAKMLPPQADKKKAAATKKVKRKEGEPEEPPPQEQFSISMPSLPNIPNLNLSPPPGAAPSPPFSRRLSGPPVVNQVVPSSPDANAWPPSQKEESPPPAPLTSSGKRRQFLINPLTGHLEPAPSDSSSESEHEEAPSEPFPERFSDDESRKEADQSDSEAKQPIKLLQQLPTTTTPTTPSADFPAEKIKLRLKLEPNKNEPVAAAYKVDVSYVNVPPVKKVLERPLPQSRLFAGLTAPPTPTTPNPPGSPLDEQPRVPPLHISLRGRNAAVVVNSPRQSDSSREQSPSPKKVGAVVAGGVVGGPDPVDRTAKRKVNRAKVKDSGGGVEGQSKKKQARVKEAEKVATALAVPPKGPGRPDDETLPEVPKPPEEAKPKKREVRRKSASCGEQREQNLLSGGGIVGDEHPDDVKALLARKARRASDTKIVSPSSNVGLKEAGPPQPPEAPPPPSVENGVARGKAFPEGDSHAERRDSLEEDKPNAKDLRLSSAPISVKVLPRSSPSEAGLSLSSSLTQELDPGLLPLSPSSSYNLMHSDTSVILTEKSHPKGPIKEEKPNRHPLNLPNTITAIAKPSLTCPKSKQGEPAPKYRKVDASLPHPHPHPLDSTDLVVNDKKVSLANLKKMAAKPSTLTSSESYSKMSRLAESRKESKESATVALPLPSIDISVMNSKISAAVKDDKFLIHKRDTPVTSLDTEKQAPQQQKERVESPSNGGNGAHESGNTQGEDSGIESMDALSEKSPNQGESPLRKEEKDEPPASSEPVPSVDEAKCPEAKAVTEPPEVKPEPMRTITANSKLAAALSDMPNVPTVFLQSAARSAEGGPTFGMRSSKLMPIKLVKLPSNAASGQALLELSIPKSEASSSSASPVKILVPKMSPMKQPTMTAVVVKSVVVTSASNMINMVRNASVQNEAKEETSLRWLPSLPPPPPAPTVASPQRDTSPSSEDPQPFRVTPALYTYSNTEKHRDSPSPSADELGKSDEPPQEEQRIVDEKNSPVLAKNEVAKSELNSEELSPLSQNYSLMKDASDEHNYVARSKVKDKRLGEQLRIEIPLEPSEAEDKKPVRNTRSSARLVSPDLAKLEHRTPAVSPADDDVIKGPLSSSSSTSSKLSPNATTPRSGVKRKRQESESSATSSIRDEQDETSPPLSDRPGKRKCSENAAELIKACMGVDDTPNKKLLAVAMVKEEKRSPSSCSDASDKRAATRTRRGGSVAAGESSDDDQFCLDSKGRQSRQLNKEDRSGAKTPQRTPRSASKEEAEKISRANHRMAAVKVVSMGSAPVHQPQMQHLLTTQPPEKRSRLDSSTPPPGSSETPTRRSNRQQQAAHATTVKAVFQQQQVDGSAKSRETRGGLRMVRDPEKSSAPSPTPPPPPASEANTRRKTRSAKAAGTV